jgi:hypothetical protein
MRRNETHDRVQKVVRELLPQNARVKTVMQAWSLPKNPRFG